MGIIFKTPITEEQVRENVKIVQNESALEEIRASIRTETSNRTSEDMSLRQDLSALRGVVTEEINLRTEKDNELNERIELEEIARANAALALQANLDTEIENRNISETKLRDNFNAALDDEKRDRQNADTELNNNLLAALSSETALRETADNNLRLALGSETALRTAADNILDVAISAEAQSRSIEDGKLNDALEVERKARDDADKQVTQNFTLALGSETALRAAADNILDVAISSEAASRAAADSSLREDIFRERNDRQQADIQMLTAIQNAVSSEAAAREATLENMQSSLANTFATYAPINSPNFTGAPKAPNIQSGANNLQIANKKYVDDKFAGVSASLNVFTKNSAGFVPPPPDSDDEQILVANKRSNLYGWRSVTSSTVYINNLPTQSFPLTYELNKNQSPSWNNYDPSQLKIGGTTSAANAGTYTATFKPVDLYVWGSDNTQSTKNATWVINKRSIEKPRATQTVFTYRPEGWAPNVVIAEPAYMTQSGTDSAVAQGTYTITYTLNSTQNTQWADGSTSPATIVWKINKMDIQKPQLVGSSEVDYKDGALVSPNITRITAGYVAQIGTDTATAVGSYVAIYHLTDANTQWEDGSTADVRISWSVVQKNLPAEFSSGFEQTGTLTYDGGAKSPNIAHYSSTYHTITGNTATDAGTYTAYISPISGYTWSDGSNSAKPVSWKIDPQAIAPPTQTQASFDYTGNKYDFTKYTSGYVPAKMNRSGDTDGTVAKTYATTFTLKNPSGKTNYVWSDDGSTRTVTLSWSIGNRVLTAEQSTGFAQIAPLTFNGNTQNLTPSNISNFSTSFHVLGGVTSGSDAKTYTATVAPITGYTWYDGTTTPKNVTWAISPKVVYRPSAPVISFTTDGNAHFIDDSDHYDPLYMTRTGTTTPQTAAGNYTTTYTLRNASGKQNYVWDNGTYTQWSIGWAIGVRLLKIPEANIVEPYVFNEPPNNTKTLVVKNLDSDWQDYAELRSDSVVTASDAGTYKAYYHITDTSKATWSDKSTTDKEVVWTIARKPLTAKQSEFAGTYTDEFTFSYKYNGQGYVAENYTADVKEFSSTVFDPRYHEFSTTSSTSSTTTTGTFTVTIVPLPNYAWNDGTYAGKKYTWKVNKLSVKITGITLQEQTSNGIWLVTSAPITYDGQEHSISSNFLKTPDTVIINVSNTTPAISGATAVAQKQTQAGKYITAISIASGFPFKNQCTLCIGAEEKLVDSFYLLWEIARKPIDPVTFSVNGSYTYDSTEQPVSINGYDSTTMTISSNRATIAGTHTALISPDANHCWSDGTTDTVPVDWVIYPKMIDYPTAAEVDFPYDKKSHSLDITGYLPTYMTQTGTNTATAAGSYSVTFTLRDTANTAWSSGLTSPYHIEWSIGLTKIDIPTPKTTTFIFSEGVLREPAFDNIDTANVTMSGDVNATNAKDTPYTVIFSLKDTDTTVWSDGSSSPKPFRWTIARKSLSATQSTFVQSGTLNYNGSSYNVTGYVTNYDSRYHSIGGQMIQTNAGTYTAQIQPLSNYQWNEGGYTAKPVIWQIHSIEIAKPEITDPLPIEFDGKSHTPTVTNYTGNESFITRTGDYGAKTAEGNYWITFTLKNTNNTTWAGGDVEPVKLNWAIEKKMVTIPKSIETTFKYDRNLKTLRVSNPDSAYCTQIDGVTSARDVGDNYFVKYRLNDTSLTTWADGTTNDKTIYWKITPDTLGKVFTNMVLLDKKYTGNSITALRYVNGSYYLNYYDENGVLRETTQGTTYPIVYAVDKTGDTEATDVGEYTLLLTPTENYVWPDGTRTPHEIPWRINPAPVTSSMMDQEVYIVNTALIANGTAQSPTIYRYKPETMVLGGDVSKTEKGNYTITLAPDDNHCWTYPGRDPKEVMEFDWQIVKNVFTVPEPNSASIPFDGGTHAPFEYDTEKIIGTNISASDVGTYTATFTLADTVSCEWADGTTTPKTKTWTISPKTITVPEVNGNVKLVYSGATFLVKDALIGYDSDTMTLGSDTSKKDAGDYTVTVTPKANCAWVGGSTSAKSLSWKIHRQPLREVSVTTYIDCNTDNSTVRTTPYIRNEDDTGWTTWQDYTNYITATGISGTSVGEQHAVFSLKSNYCWADGTTGNKNLTWYIRKRYVIYPKPRQTQEDYTGHNVSFAITSPSPNRVYIVENEVRGGASYWDYVLVSDHSFDSYRAQSNVPGQYLATAVAAGEYYVKFALNDTAHYCWYGTWSADNPTGDSTPYTLNFYIGTAGKSVIAPPELTEGAPAEVPYNGSAWDYLNSYILGYDTATMVASSTSATNAGTYTLKIDLKDKTNTIWEGGGTATKSFSWKITPTLVDKPTVAQTELVYNGQAQSLDISGFDSNLMSQTGTASATNVTNTSVTFALRDKTNYRWADNTTANVTVSWKIVAASLPKPKISSASSFEYSGAAKSITVANYNSNLMTAEGFLSGTTAGSYTVTYSLKNKTYSKWEDGSTANVSLTWEITPKKLTLEQSTLMQAQPIPTYTGSEITVTVTNFSASYHEYTSDSTITATNASAASGYFVYIKPKANYCWNNGTTTAKRIKWQIARAYIEPPTASLKTFEYTGSETDFLSGYVSGFDPAIMEYRNNGHTSTISGDSNVTFRSKATATGKYRLWIELKSALEDNYTFSKEYNSIATSIPWEITPTYLPKPRAGVTSFTYCGETQGITVEDYDSTTTAMSGTILESDAGTYSATFALSDKTNYRWAGGNDDTADVTISWEIKKLGTLPLPGTSNFGVYGLTNYTGSVQKPEIRMLMKYFTQTGRWGAVTGSDVTVAVKNGAVQSAILKWYNVTGDFSGTNAGDYTVTFTPNKNCTWGSGGTEGRALTWTIPKANQTITPAKTSVTLNDDNITSTVTLTAAGGGTVSVTSGDTNIVVASYSTSSKLITLTAKQNGTATVTVAQASNANYNAAANKVITVKVDRSIESLSWSEIQTYSKNGTLLKYSEIGDTKSLKVQGTVGALSINNTYRAVLIGFDHNEDYEGSNRAHFAICKANNGDDFVFTDSMYNKDSDNNHFVATGANYSGATPNFTGTSVYVRLNEFLSALPSALQSVITACTKYNVHGNILQNFSAKMWTLSTTEIAGGNAPVSNAKADQYEYFKFGNSISANKYFWLRDLHGGGTINATLYICQGGQTFAAGTKTKSYGIVPCFTIS